MAATILNSPRAEQMSGYVVHNRVGANSPLGESAPDTS
jgi:hypothetical protein